MQQNFSTQLAEQAKNLSTMIVENKNANSKNKVQNARFPTKQTDVKPSSTEKNNGKDK